MPPDWLYRGGLLPVRISGRYESASSSQVVTCAKGIFDRPLAHDARFHQLGIGQAGVGLRERCPGLLQSFQQLVFLHASASASF